MIAVAAGGAVAAASAFGFGFVSLVSLAGGAIGASDASLAVLFCFDDIRRRAANDQHDHKEGDPICGCHA